MNGVVLPETPKLDGEITGAVLPETSKQDCGMTEQAYLQGDGIKVQP